MVFALYFLIISYLQVLSSKFIKSNHCCFSIYSFHSFIMYLSRLCRVEETIASINVVLAAMPVASYGTLFCIQYQKGEIIMAEGTFLTTLLSVLSIPLLTMFL